MLHFTPLKALGISLTALLVCLCAASIFFPEATLRTLPQWMQRRIVVGLDLRDGSYLVLALDPNYIRKQRLEQIRDHARTALYEIQVPHSRIIRGDAVEIRLRKPDDAAKALPALRGISGPPGGIADTSTLRDVDVRDMGEGSFRLTIPDAAMEERLRRILEQSITIVERRINGLDTVAPIIQRQGSDRFVVYVPGMSDPTRLKELLGKTGQMEFRMIDTTVSPELAQVNGAPAGSEVLRSVKSERYFYVVKTDVLVSGGDLDDARLDLDRFTNEPVVDFSLNSVGRERFARLTTNNVGLPFAIVLDGKVVAAPVIRAPITGGQGQIAGNFSVQEARDLAMLLRSGALPVPLIVVEERVVEPARSGSHR